MSRYWSDRLLAWQVVAFAATVPLLLRLRLDRVSRWLATGAAAADEPSPEQVMALVCAIDRWLVRGRPIVRSGCLTRAVTLYRFLRRAGAQVSLRFGIGAVDGVDAAHCWVVYRGEPLAEIRDPRHFYTEMWAITP